MTRRTSFYQRIVSNYRMCYKVKVLIDNVCEFFISSYNLSHQSPAFSPDHTSRVTYCDTFVQKNETNLWKYKYMFILAQLFHGVGATPLYTLGVTYLDENLKTKVTPVYVGEYRGSHGIFKITFIF